MGRNVATKDEDARKGYDAEHASRSEEVGAPDHYEEKEDIGRVSDTPDAPHRGRQTRQGAAAQRLYRSQKDGGEESGCGVACGLLERQARS